MKVIQVPISEIKIEERQKRPLGDIDGLVASIEDVSLLHPVVIGTDKRLKVGYRRLMAFKQMDRNTIPAHITDELDDVLDALRAERDENVQREALPPSLLVERARELHEEEERRARERQLATLKQGNESPVKENFLNGEETGQTRDKVAAAFGISGKTYEKAKQVVDAAEEDPETYGDLPQMMDKGSVHKAHRELVKRQRQEAPPLPSDKYRIIYADPPWKYNDSGIIGETDHYGHVHRHYPTMSIQELCDLGEDIKELAESNAVLFLWVPSPQLEDSFKVINAWGFKYKTSFVWDKVKHNYGHYNSVRHEFLLICTRGSCTPDINTLYDSVVSIERSDRHSEKPEEFRVIIDDLYTHGKRIELFARTEIDGWDSWGNEPPG